MGGEPASSEQRLFLRQHLIEPVELACGRGGAVVITAPSPLREDARDNEDGALVLDLGAARGLLAVADGVGGSPGGAQAAEAALTTLADVVRRGVDAGDELRVAIMDGLERAQDEVRGVGGGAATTLAVVGLEQRRMRAFHAGDSEVLLVGQRGRVKYRTVSHAPVAYALDSGYLEEREALEHDDRHLISNALGLPEARIEVGPSRGLSPRDTLLLATDGLTDNLYFQEIVDGIRTGPIVSRAGNLAAAVAERMRSDDGSRPAKPDDVTVVLWRGSAEAVRSDRGA